MPRDRWDWLEQLKPESAIAASVRHVARMIADDLGDWPPDIALGEGPNAERFADVVKRDARRPTPAAFREALERVTWELARDFDAIDFYERNHHLEAACPDIYDQLASELIRHYVLESFFVLMEKTDNRVKRKDVAIGVELLRRHLAERDDAS